MAVYEKFILVDTLYFNCKSLVCEKIFVILIFSRRYLFWRFTGKFNFGDLLKNDIFGVLRKIIFLAFYEILAFSSSLFFGVLRKKPVKRIIFKFWGFTILAFYWQPYLFREKDFIVQSIIINYRTAPNKY